MREYRLKNSFTRINSTTVEILLRGLNGTYSKAIIDAEDFDKVSAHYWRCTAGNNQKPIYAWTNRRGAKGKEQRRILMHRFILGFPENETDHANRNGLDNRKSNLRVCDRYQNAQNTSRKKGRSGFRGVKITKNNTFFARITANGKSYYLGSFKTATEAATAYNQASLKYHKEFGVLNNV